MVHRGLRILMIGPTPPPLGGTTVLFQHLADSLRVRHDIVLTVVSTSGTRGGGLASVGRCGSMLLQVLAALPRTDVVTLHASITGIPFIGPVIYGLALLCRKPLIVRKFGGTDFRDSTVRRWLRPMGEWVVRRSHLYLVETKQLLETAKRNGIERVEWYANSRTLHSEPAWRKGDSSSCKRYVFLSQVKPAKGIRQLIEASERLADITVDVYGPFLDGMSEQDFAGLKNIHYRGTVPPEEAMEVLKRYDALVFPTVFKGEGYPGIIVEAYCVGLPVITCRIGAIDEIVDNTSGLLLEPGDVDALHEAMKSLVEDDELYVRLREGAWAKRLLFDSKVWTERFVVYCRQLAHAS